MTQRPPIALAVLLAILTWGCVLPLRGSGQRRSCARIANVDSVVAPGRVVIFGEMHGTEQSPAFVGQVLCNAVARDLPATLALELPVESTPRLDAYVHSSGSATDRATLLADSMWHFRPADGRTSEAMVALLDSTRALAHSGADVHVLAFSRSARSGQMRDSLMALTLADAARAHPERVIVGLAGNVHSRSAPGTPFDSTYRPMTYLLRAMLPQRRVLGLNASFDAGTAWVCMSDEPCGPHAIKGKRLVPIGTIQLGALQEAYDGLYGVAPLTPSKPAVP